MKNKKKRPTYWQAIGLESYEDFYWDNEEADNFDELLEAYRQRFIEAVGADIRKRAIGRVEMALECSSLRNDDNDIFDEDSYGSTIEYELQEAYEQSRQEASVYARTTITVDDDEVRETAEALFRHYKKLIDEEYINE